MAGKMENPVFVTWAAEFLRRKFEEQPWWQRKSNTVTTAAGLLVTIGTWVASHWAAEPWAPTIALFVGFIATVFGVSKTPNGITMRDVQRLEYAAGRAGAQMPVDKASLAAETALEALRNAEQVTNTVEQYRSRKR